MSDNEYLKKMQSLHKIFAMIPEEEFSILQDSGILTKNFDLWLAVLIAKKLQEDGYIDEKGNRTEKVRRK